MNSPVSLNRGDCLLYGASDFFGVVTRLKTWSPAVHVEVYAGAEESFASRNGIGCDVYPFRDAQLIAVLRPKFSGDFQGGADWFWAQARGKKYGWLDLLAFVRVNWNDNRIICSTFATEFYRHSGFDPFNPQYDSREIAPGDFMQSVAFSWQWTKPGVRF